MAGDFNAKHKKIGCKYTNKKGKDLVRYQKNRNYGYIVPDEPTHVSLSYLSTDSLDYKIYKNITRNITIKTLAETTSDYIPIFIEIHGDKVKVLETRTIIK